MNLNKLLIIIVLIGLLVLSVVGLRMFVAKQSDNGVNPMVTMSNTPAPQDMQATPQPSTGNEVYIYYMGDKFQPASTVNLTQGDVIQLVNRTYDEIQFEVSGTTVAIPVLLSLEHHPVKLDKAGEYVITVKGKTSPSLTVSVK